MNERDSEGPFLPQPQEHPSPPGMVERIGEAELLLTFATQRGLEVEPGTIEAVVAAREQAADRAWGRETEVAFWQAFDALAKLVLPATVSSLSASLAGPPGAPPSRAQEAVRRYQSGTLLCLLLTLLFQIYWGYGQKIVDAIVVELPGLELQLRGELADVARKLTEARARNAGAEEVQPLVASKDALNTRIGDIGDQRKSYYDILRIWSGVPCLGWFCSEVISDKEKFAERGYMVAQQSAQLMLEPLQEFILPLLYGLLGAFAYVLRAITEELKGFTFTPSSESRYRLRLQLGALSGLAVVWLLSPTESATAAQVTGQAASQGIGELSPLALAFVAGYSVELLFSAMDRVVSAFSGPAGGGKAGTA